MTQAGITFTILRRKLGRVRRSALSEKSCDLLWTHT